MATRNSKNLPAIKEIDDYHDVNLYKVPEVGIRCKEVNPESFGYEFHGYCGLKYYGLIYRNCLPNKKVISGLLEKKLKKTMWRKNNGC